MMVPHGCLSAEFSPSTITDRGVGIMRNSLWAEMGRNGPVGKALALVPARPLAGSEYLLHPDR